LVTTKRYSIAASVFLLAVAGCAPRWQFAYDEAVRLARRQERDMLVFYKDPLDINSGKLRDAVESAGVQPLANEMVRCLLVPSYPPNRSFVAQYGVRDTPALIVIHPDGTYHRLKGVHSAREVRSFLESARGPGLSPELNPRIPRGATFDYFNIYERAVETAQRQGRPLIIIYKWWVNPESTELIRRISRPEVARYFAESVNCILDWDHVPNRSHVKKYGVTKFPAIIIVEPDGRYRSLTGLPAVDRIVRFVVASPSGHEQKESSGRTSTVVWFADFDAADLVSQRTGKSLFLFYHSNVSDRSQQVAHMLDDPELRSVLSKFVTCRLDWSHQANRNRMAHFGVRSVPAGIVVHGDGSYDLITRDFSIRNLKDFLLSQIRVDHAPFP